MLLNIQTSRSEMIPIKDFRYLCDLAKCSKCQLFVLLRNTNKLYGALEDGCCIHEIDVPYLVDSDLFFRVDNIDKEILEQHEFFFIPDKFNWTILPAYYWNMYIGGDIIADGYQLVDRTTNQPIQQIITPLADFNNDHIAQLFLNQVEGMLIRFSRLSQPITFQNMESNPDIRKTYDGKTAAGRVACRLKCGEQHITFYIFKALFTLNKADTLDVDIRFDLFDKNLFMATFKPKKKKNPLTFSTYGVAFQERIHCMYVNMT